MARLAATTAGRLIWQPAWTSRPTPAKGLLPSPAKPQPSLRQGVSPGQGMFLAVRRLPSAMPSRCISRVISRSHNVLRRVLLLIPSKHLNARRCPPSPISRPRSHRPSPSLGVTRVGNQSGNRSEEACSKLILPGQRSTDLTNVGQGRGSFRAERISRATESPATAADHATASHARPREGIGSSQIYAGLFPAIP